MAKKFKTNALRRWDKAKIAYLIKEYEYDEDHLDGRHVASQVDMVPEAIFKTLVLHDNHNEYLVCCVPVLEEIDLKKLAKLAGVTGYMRGGCSPVGMKEQFPTYMDESILKVDEVAFSAGKRGFQMIVKVQDILTYLNVETGDIIRK